MAYDLLIKNGRVIDGSGLPAFRGDVAVSHGKIVATGKLRDSATRTIDADGLVVAPGFIDNHCHYDAQVTWDPMCSFSCYHGATSVIIGNCSLALTPVRRGREERLADRHWGAHHLARLRSLGGGGHESDGDGVEGSALVATSGGLGFPAGGVTREGTCVPEP
jgi:N-acyl-D-amino-acid deacylase